MILPPSPLREGRGAEEALGFANTDRRSERIGLARRLDVTQLKKMREAARLMAGRDSHI